MSLFAKIMVVVNFLLAAAFLAAAGTFLGAAEDWKARYEKTDKDLRDQIASLDAQVKARDTTIATEKAARESAEKAEAAASATLKQLQESNANLNARNQALEQSLQTLADAQKDLQAKNAELNTNLDKTRGDLSTTKSALNASRDEVRTLQENLARAETDRENAEKALAAAETKSKSDAEALDAAKMTIRMYQDRFGGLGEAMQVPSIEGVVQAASDKDDIYVISVGEKDKVKVGFEFTVYRDSEYVSKIVIDKVWPNYATGRTKPGHKRKDIQPGDNVSTRL